MVLVGARGCGKTTVAKELAALLHGEARDLDDLIESTVGRSISEIFATDGETFFRRLESQAMNEAFRDYATAKTAVCVLSLGGGAVLAQENQRLLREQATVIWLQADAATLVERIAADVTSINRRPALTEFPLSEEVAHLLASREPVYESVADLVVNTEAQTPINIANSIVKQLTQSEQL